MEKKLNFTDQALNQINIITKDQDKKFFRITVQGGGCSGFKYNFGFDTKTNDDDVVFGKVIKGMDLVDYMETVETDSNDRPINEIKIVDSGLL